jgi:SAM-dependent methyltransferase
LEVTYALDRLPKTAYPARLAAYLVESIYRKAGRLLDIGCGRGEYLQEFSRLGFGVVGTDSAESARTSAGGFEVRKADFEGESLPFSDAEFEFVFSKSVIEHLRQPERLIAEALRVLKPGGKAVFMTPSWRHQRRIFYEDMGHVKPFGLNALADALTLGGFREVDVRYFRQLPALWSTPTLAPVAWATALLPLPYRPWDKAPWPEALNTWIRFSKEVMLLGTAVKAGRP